MFRPTKAGLFGKAVVTWRRKMDFSFHVARDLRFWFSL
jgi:hypothetical protein